MREIGYRDKFSVGIDRTSRSEVSAHARHIGWPSTRIEVKILHRMQCATGPREKDFTSNFGMFLVERIT